MFRGVGLARWSLAWTWVWGRPRREILHYVLHDELAVGSTETLGRAGIQHRGWMTGNQPEHDPWLPRSCARAERAAYLHGRTYVLLLSKDVGCQFSRGWWARWVIAHALDGTAQGRALRPMVRYGRRGWGEQEVPPLGSGRRDGWGRRGGCRDEGVARLL